MTSKMFDSGRRFGRHARNTLFGERGRNTAARVYGTGRQFGRQARGMLLGDRTRNAANKVYENGRQAWRQARNSVLPKLVQSIRRSIGRLVTRIRT